MVLWVATTADGGDEAEIDASGIADGVVGVGDISIPAGLLHDSTGMPADCGVVSAAWQAGAVSAVNINGFEPGQMSADGVAARR